VPSWVGTDYLAAPNGFTGISGAAALIFFAYLGFDELGNFAEEMRRPERDLPRALFVAMITTTAIYVLSRSPPSRSSRPSGWPLPTRRSRSSPSASSARGPTPR
jgi:hypothetical protein